MKTLLWAIAATLGSISYFIVLLFLFMLIVSLLGMELFAYNIRFYDNFEVATDKIQGRSPRINFDTFYNAMISVFILLTSENWNMICYLFMLGLDSWAPALFFCFVIIIGNFILLKLFIAILLYNFGQSSIEAKRKIDE